MIVVRVALNDPERSEVAGRAWVMIEGEGDPLLRPLPAILVVAPGTSVRFFESSVPAVADLPAPGGPTHSTPEEP